MPSYYSSNINKPTCKHKNQQYALKAVDIRCNAVNKIQSSLWVVKNLVCKKIKGMKGKSGEMFGSITWAASIWRGHVNWQQ